MLGYCYKYGAGVRKNKKEAIKWFQRATRQGNVGAEYELRYVWQQHNSNSGAGDAVYVDAYWQDIYNRLGKASESVFPQRHRLLFGKPLKKPSSNIIRFWKD